MPAGDLREWDGLLTWFIEFLKRNRSHIADKYIRRWHRAALEKMHAVRPVIPADPQTAAPSLAVCGPLILALDGWTRYLISISEVLYGER